MRNDRKWFAVNALVIMKPYTMDLLPSFQGVPVVNQLWTGRASHCPAPETDGLATQGPLPYGLLCSETHEFSLLTRALGLLML